MTRPQARNLGSFLMIFFLFLSYNALAQTFFYSNANKIRNAYNVLYITGKQDDNIVVWLCRYFENTLQVSIYDSKMNLLQHAQLKLTSIADFYSINFLKKENCYDVLLQYTSAQSNKAAVFSFDKSKNTIVMSNIIAQSDNLCCGGISKHSFNENYAGLIKAYKTAEDSIIVQYAIYNNQNEPLKDISFLLPQKHNFINFDGALIDSSGNLFFCAFNNGKATGSPPMTIYEVNLKKDSLLQNDVYKTGHFSDVQIQQNNTNGNLIVSGIWADDQPKTKYRVAGNKPNLFLMELNENLSQQQEMTLFAANAILDSSYRAPYELHTAKLILYKDSGYLFYLTGLTDYRSKAVIPTSGDKNHKSFYSTEAIKGRNFFTAFKASNKGISSIYNFKDKTAGVSLPQFEYVANTGKNIHYIYSRKVNKNKQLIFDLVFENSGQMHLNPVITRSGYTLLLDNGAQVGSNAVVFPFINKNAMSFAKMELE